MAYFTGVSDVSVLFGAATLVLVLYLRHRRAVPKGLSLPPGPRGWPIAGNVADMPKEQEWVTFTQWNKYYGDLVSIQVFGQPMMSISSPAIAHELFETRSSLYSDRCEFPMFKLMGANWFFGQHRYGDVWRWHRKAFHQFFNATVVTRYRDIETKHARILLRRLHDSHESFMEHLRHFPGAIIMEVVYGIKVLPEDDPYIDIAEKSMTAASAAGNPGTFLVDVLPMLRHVPEWFPGASFKRKARIWRQSILKLPLVPFEAVKEAIRAGTAPPSVVASMLEETPDKKNAPPNVEEGIRYTAAAAYAAGADTTVSALKAFVLAMVLYPGAQQKAQAELDAVLGDRLPEFSDRENLPYVNALCKEIHRWHTVGPLGVAHAVTKDDVYGKYFIPRGSIVLANAWAMLHDEKTYGPNTDQFIPDRFFQPGVPDSTIAFGFGRRICPGRFFADDSVFIAVASVLKMYSISPAKDAEGNEIAVEAKFTSGFISHPAPFVCSIRPRSASAESLLSECPHE
ncbi:putative CyP450 monooxygenase [Ramaria rubella]|nr:putative CyP450 monooxygenase [Ramaria rubella]